jgi:UDPglucose 6-dehydrogenase
MRLSVIGLGKLGAPLAAVFASKGHDVIGVETCAERVSMLAAGKAPVQEPHLQQLIDSSKARIIATASYEEAVVGSDVTFVIVPTPTDEYGRFSNKHVLAAVEEVGKALYNKASYHVLAIGATVMPGSTGGQIRDAVEQSSGRRVGEDLGLCYNPEFVALGSVIHDLLNPDFILLGESDAKAGKMMENLYRSVCDNNPPIRRMDLMNAEIAKLSLNAYVTTKISFANMLAEICERLPGADVDLVTSAIGLDSRIGAKCLKAATSYGGPCFPRDNLAFSMMARMLGPEALIAEATDRLNRRQVDRLVAHVRRQTTPGGTVGILGLSYKADTSLVDESAGVGLAIRLRDAGYIVKAFDPMASDPGQEVLGPDIISESIESCVHGVSVLVITTPWPEFSNLDPAMLERPGKRCVIVDCWRVLPKERFNNVAEIIYLGRGDDWVPEPA